MKLIPAIHQLTPNTTEEAIILATHILSGQVEYDPLARIKIEKHNITRHLSLAEFYLENISSGFCDYDCPDGQIRQRIDKPGLVKTPAVIQDAILKLAEEGNLTADETKSLVMLASKKGAEEVYLNLTQQWTPKERLEAAKSHTFSSLYNTLSGAWAYLYAGFNNIFRQLLEDGLDIQERTTKGQGFGHYISSSDIIPDLKKAGLDPNIVDNNGYTAPAFWTKAKHHAARTKTLSNAWYKAFAEQVDMDQARKTLLTAIGSKPKGTLEAQMKAANLKNKDLVNGESLAKHAIRSVLLNRYFVPQPAALRMLMNGARDMNELIWPVCVACGFNIGTLKDHLKKHSKSKISQGLDRLNAIQEAIEILCEPLDYHQAWVNVEKWALVRSEKDSLSDNKKSSRRVTEEQWFEWLSQENNEGQPRILAFAQNRECDSTLLSRYLSLKKNLAPDKNLPGDPQEWLFWTFHATCMTQKNRNITSHLSNTQNNYIEFNWETQAAGNCFIKLWEAGIRPDPQTANLMLDIACDYQKGMITYLEAVVIEEELNMNTAGIAREKNHKTLRL